MKITLNNKEEIELTEREELIYQKAEDFGSIWGLIIGAIIGIALTIISYQSCSAQISPSLRAGYNQRMKSPLIAPSIMFEAHNIVMQPELIIYAARNAPASFGLKIGYTLYGFTAGYGKYFDMYSTDKYDRNLNGFSDVGFVRYSSGKYYVQADWHKWFELSAGVKIYLTQLK